MQTAETREAQGRPKPLVVLLCGASHMGKSYTAKNVLEAEFGALYMQVDKLYTVALRTAGLIGGDAENTEAARRARRLARDRKWRAAGHEADFFGAYRSEVVQMLKAGAERQAPVIFEGGTLRHSDEAKLIARAARKVLGNDARVARAIVVVPYTRWLSNRVQRMSLAGRDHVALSGLTREAYRREVVAARPAEALRGVTEFTVKSQADVRAMMETFTPG